MRIRHWVLCAAALSLGLTGGRQAFAQGRLYFSGQFGAGNTYNLYELKGAGDINVAAGARLGRYQVLNGTNLSFSTGDAQTMRAAHNSAATTLETISGTNKPAHLTAFSGPTAAAENFFCRHTYLVHQQQRVDWIDGR